MLTLKKLCLTALLYFDTSDGLVNKRCLHILWMDCLGGRFMVPRPLTNAARVRFPAGDLIQAP